MLEPVLMPLWVYVAGMETPQWWTVAGASIILAGLFLRYAVLEGLLVRTWRVGGLPEDA